MKKNSVFIIVFIILTGFTCPAFAAQWLYVKSAKAKLFSEPSFKASLVSTVDRGTRLETLRTQGRWIEVKYDDHNGWISKLLTSKNPPPDKTSVLEGQADTLEDSARRRASTNASAAATRGLRGEKRTRASDKGHPDYSALEQVESAKTSEQDAQEFHQQGVSD
jgi:hypothetical protein